MCSWNTLQVIEVIQRASKLYTSELSYLTQQFLLQNVLPFFVLLRAFIRPIVLPSHHLFALSAADVTDDVAASGHVTLACLALLDIHDGIEKVGFAMLATKVLPNSGQQSVRPLRYAEVRCYTHATDDLVMIGKMCLAVLTAVNALSIEVDVVGQAHPGR